MFRNNLLSVLRNMGKHKLLSVINISGLSIGIATALAIALFILDELKYDKFHEKAQSIYRIAMYAGEDFHNPLTPMPLAPLLTTSFPEIKKAVRIYKNRSNAKLIEYKDKKFYEQDCIYADSAFFDVFSFPLIRGNKQAELTQPNTIIISESAARKYFGTEDPIGKVLKIDNEATGYQVTGVLKNIPAESHVHFDFLLPFASMEQQHKDNWLIPFMFTYILLQDNYKYQALEPKLTRVAVEHMNPQVKEALGLTYEEMLKKDNKSYHLYLQPLTSIHLHSNLKVELEPNGNIKYIYIFSVIGILVLLLACINFMNLSTARATSRTKEISVRKVIGATRRQLAWQFMNESIFVSFVATVFAVLVVWLSLPFINQLIHKNIRLFRAMDSLWILLPCLALVVGVISGSYPAFYLSGLNPIKIFKRFSVQTNSSISIRKILVTTQFAISSALIIGIGIVYQQLQFMQTTDIGFNKNQLISFSLRGGLDVNKKIEFKNELLQNPSVKSVSLANYIPGEEAYENQDMFLPEGKSSKERVPLWYVNSDFDYVSTMELKLVSGRSFSKDLASDSSAYLVNETAARQLGWTPQTALGKKIYSFENNPERTITKTIIGVVKDFHIENFATSVKPVLLGIDPHYWWKFIVKIDARNIDKTLAYVQSKWNIYQPSYLFEYTFLQDSFARFWQSEQSLAKLATVFTVLAVMIACLGLFALSMFITEQRTKEIGIRKLLGSSVIGILGRISKEMLQLVLIGALVAIPVTWWAMSLWLQDFVYRINVSIWLFVAGALLALVIAFFTVCIQAIKAAIANPVKSLRTE